jgi:bifunctional non-homologous end joining protein LigD
VVGGWTESTAAGRRLRAILVGYFERGRFIYAGRIGTGFTAETEAELLARLRKQERKDPPFVSIPSDARRGVHWTDPKVVIEAEFATWTQDGVIRHASFKGIREDKDPEEVTLEVPLDSPKNREPAGDRSKAYGGVVLTNPDRVLWPEEGITKEALADYYATVAFRILPHVVNRPLSLVRCPDGIKGDCFFQRHMGRGLTSGVRAVKARDEREPYIAIDDLAGLFSLVQAATLEIHPWGARADDPDHPDRMIMDFDPGESVSWSRVVDAALQCRDRLDRLGLISFVKTTGGKGLHVVVPLARRHSWTEVKNFAQALAAAMAADDPIYVTTMRKSARQGRIYIDYLRNDFTSSAIAPYSTRARPGAPVAMPLGWDELRSVPSGRHYTLKTAPRRLASLRHDPWEGMEKMAQRLTSKAKRALGLADVS